MRGSFKLGCSQSVAPTWKQLGFMYLVLLLKLQGLLTFYFYRAQKKREREPFAQQVPKKTPEPPSEGLGLRQQEDRGVGKDPLASGTPQAQLLLPTGGQACRTSC